MKLWILLIFIGAGTIASAESVAVGDAAGWDQAGRNHYLRCEFKDAARAFTKALQYRPKDSHIYHWLGKSYARMAEVASLLHASRDARKARLNLERAVELDPHNQEYLRTLFDFYLDSPEWLGGGLDKADLLVERIAPDDSGAQAFLRQLVANARQECSSPDWRIGQAMVWPSVPLGRIAP